MQKFSDAPLKVHENCGGELEKVLSAPAIQFKGSGWYITDYARGKSSGGSNGKTGKSESKPETKTDSKTESKPAEKAKTEK